MSNDEQFRDRIAFPETRWSRIISLQGGAGQRDTEEAVLADLCQDYWQPVYVFIRRRGYSPEEAEDATQDFFVELLSRESFAKADPKRGRLRTFLLSILNGFLAQRARNGSRLKRGGGRQLISLDVPEAELQLAPFLANLAPQETVFDRVWAKGVFLRAKQMLCEEYHGDPDVYREFIGQLGLPDEKAPLPSPAAQSSAKRVALYRFRLRFRNILEAILRETVASAEDLRDELKYLAEMSASID